MPLVYKPEPAEVNQVVKAHLGEMASKKAFRTPALAKMMLREAAPPPTPTQALPVYHLGLKDLAEKGDTTSAALKSWRFLVKQGEEIVASADAIIGPDKKPVFSHVNEGPLVKGAVLGIQAANSNDEIKKGQYEVRLLMIPAIYVAALWLVDAAGKRDLAVPLEPTAPPLVANKVIPLNELMTIAQKLAKASLSAQQPDQALGG
jgi:hypothetical protein